MAGAVSGERGFIDSYKNGIDLHSRNAIVSFGLQIDKSQYIQEAKDKGLTGSDFDVYVERATCKYVKKHYPDERSAAKSVSFNILEALLSNK